MFDEQRRLRVVAADRPLDASGDGEFLRHGAGRAQRCASVYGDLPGSQITLDLTSAGPPSTISMGFGVGAWDGTTCSLLSGGFATVQAGPTPQLAGNINSGQYCAMVFDVGNQAGPISYTAVVLHY